MALKQNKELTPEPEPTEVVEKPTEEVKAEEAPKAETPTKEDKGGTTPDILKRVEGKSPEELTKIIAEQEKMIGQQSTVINTQKEDLGRYETQQPQTPQYQQPGQFPNPYNPYGAPQDQSMGYPGYQPGYQQPQPFFPQPGMPQWGQPQPEQFNYENPMESINKAVEQRLAMAEQKRQQDEIRKYSFEMKNAYDEGKYKAFKSNPKLFKGIEQSVEGGIMAGVQRGVFTTADLRREDTWEMAGKLARLQRNEFSYLQPEQQPAISAPHSETPAGIKEETMIPVTLTPEEQAWKRMTGLTDEDVQVIKKGAK